MKLQKIVYTFVVACFVLTACKTDAKKVDAKQEKHTVNLQKVKLNISGMICEIGCAKTIQSKLSKKEGVKFAQVIFKDSLAVVKFDVNKISKDNIISFIDGIAGGKFYRTTEITK